MELRESADGLRWAIGRAGAMGCHLGANSENSGESCGRTEPDVHLIKQVEQVTTSALGGPTWLQDSEHGVTASVEILVFLIWQLLNWLLPGCKNSQTSRRGRGRPVAMLPALTDGSTRTWPHGLPSRCSAKFGETDP